MGIPRSRTTIKRIKDVRILIVDTNSEHREILENAIQQSFMDVEAVMTTDEHKAIGYLEGCAQTGKRLPQLILMDLYLPERENGWHLLKILKSKSSEIAQIPVVVFSNSGNPEDITESYDRGIASYIIKPKDFNAWLEYLQMLKDYWWETVTLPKNRTRY